MTTRLPLLARRPRRRAGWWRPGIPVHPRPAPDTATSLAQLALTEQPPACWHHRRPDELQPQDGAMRWTPSDPVVEFR